MIKTGLLLGTLLSLLTVVIGAFGAHAFKEQLIAFDNGYGKSIFEKAVLYQMFHSIGILIVSILNQFFDNTDLTLVILFFGIGILLFSGSLYILALTQIRWYGVITPIGGIFFIIGWILLFYKTLISNI